MNYDNIYFEVFNLLWVVYSEMFTFLNILG